MQPTTGPIGPVRRWQLCGLKKDSRKKKYKLGEADYKLLEDWRQVMVAGDCFISKLLYLQWHYQTLPYTGYPGGGGSQDLTLKILYPCSHIELRVFKIFSEHQENDHAA